MNDDARKNTGPKPNLRSLANLRRGGGRPKGSPNKATREIRDAARALVEDPAYRRALAKRLRNGKAPQMEVLLHHYAYGKPKETLDVDAGVVYQISWLPTATP